MIAANLMSLIWAAVVVLAGGGKLRFSWVIVFVAFTASLAEAEQFGNSASRLAGLVLLMVAVGPVGLNPSATAIRAAAWRCTVKCLPILTGIFIAWYALRLPNFGAGHFSGFMNQCMLAGPLAGVGGVIALVHALSTRGWKWWGLALLSILPVFASGSRVAFLAAAASFCYILICRKPIFGVLGAVFLAGAIISFVSRPEIPNDSPSLMSAMANKGTVNTRAELWQSRIDEFMSSPLFGIGVAMGTGSGSAVEEDGNIRVEPGSSYLAILAMSGLFGTTSFFAALTIMLVDFLKLTKRSVEKDIISAIGVFLAVHGVAEGWVLGFGSPLCFLFWLWLGKVGDVTMQGSQPVPQASNRTPRRFRRMIPALS